MTGKAIRWRRFVRPSSQMGILVPIDHGLTMGPIRGIGELKDLEPWITHPAITGIIAHKGMIERLGRRNLLPHSAGVMVQLNGMTTLSAKPDRKELVTSVEAAARLGADAVSIQLNFDGETDPHNLRMLGQVADEAHRAGLPLLTMLYDKNPHLHALGRIERLKHLCRSTIELGTDALKLAPPENLEDLPTILEGIADTTPVFFAGGSLTEIDDIRALAQAAKYHHASGLCMGRNLFQRSRPSDVLDELEDLFLRGDRKPLSHLRVAGAWSLES